MAMTHVVSVPPEPFFALAGALEIHMVPIWRDNFTWLLRCTSTGQTAAVDGAEAAPVLEYVERHGLDLTCLLTTHTHPDHIGLHRDLDKLGRLADLRVVGLRGRTDIPGLNEGVDEGDRVRLGALVGEVWRTEGHVDGHLSFVFGDALFCGDTLFAGGCGYLFDGPPAKMHASLQRLAALPDPTRVCCAHEYTEDNLRFAWSVEPDNLALAERIREVWALRAQGRASVPSTIAIEKATNPFLRGHSPTIRAHVAAAMPEAELGTPEQVFAATRKLKDLKLYKAASDDALPLAR
ncbi:hydroxyacylglutathione hydrolase [Nannocystaceae bacterium ST9]